MMSPNAYPALPTTFPPNPNEVLSLTILAPFTLVVVDPEPFQSTLAEPPKTKREGNI